MAFRRALMLFFTMSFISECNIPGRQIAGNCYVDKTFGDTLKINKAQTYDYLEKLNSGSLGLTQGKWKIVDKKILFVCDHKPLVGYRMRVHKDSLIKNLQIKLLLDNTTDPIYIENVEVFKADSVLSKNNYSKSGNVVNIFTNHYDSIVLQTFNFTALTFNHFDPKYGYQVNIYPVERLYELDKVPFSIHRNKLKSVKTQQYDNVSYTFKKLKNRKIN